MRDWFNGIFGFIGTTSITDVEYDSINFSDITNGVYNQSAYDELSAVLLAREAVSDLINRLTGVFRAKGADITQIDTAKTNIFLGDVL